MMRKLFSVTVIFFFFILSNNSNAQTVGTVYTSFEADSLYGEVIESYQIKSVELEKMVNMCKNYIMFKLENGQIHILDDSRNILMSNLNSIEDSVVFHYYSVQKVKELLFRGGSLITTFENRKKVFSVTNGFTTLEDSWNCPFVCPDELNDYVSLYIK